MFNAFAVVADVIFFDSQLKSSRSPKNLNYSKGIIINSNEKAFRLIPANSLPEIPLARFGDSANENPRGKQKADPRLIINDWCLLLPGRIFLVCRASEPQKKSGKHLDHGRII